MAETHDVEIEWKAFELRPEGVELPPKPEGYMAQAKANVERMSKQYGVDMKWNDKSKHSRRALEGAKFAEENSKGAAYHNAVFRAHFQQNKDIDDLDTLVDIAESIGLAPEAFREAIESRHYSPYVDADIEEARQIGITGIPCFIVGNRGVMGYQPYESLVKMLEENQ